MLPGPEVHRTTSLYAPPPPPSLALKRQSTLLNAVAGPSRASAAPRVQTQQLGLPASTGTAYPNAYTATKSAVQTHLPFRSLSQKKTGKTWDRTAYAATGRRVGSADGAKGTGKGKKGKGKKGKGKRVIGFGEGGEDDDESEEEEEEEGFDQFPVPFINPGG